MCPHEIYLGTCTCILKIINAREGGVGVKYGCCEGARDVSTCTCIKVLKKYTAYMYSRMKNFLSFLGQKKIGQGGSLGKGVWEPTPHLL